MVMPVTGPISEIRDIATFYLHRKRYRQMKPYDRPLPYWLQTAIVTQMTNALPSQTWQEAGALWPDDTQVQQATNKAHAKLVNEMASHASLGVTFATIDQSLLMIARRVDQLRDFTRHLRRLEFGLAAHVLGSATVPPKVGRHKSFASNWLEFYFGWSPAVGDIKAAVEVLCKPQISKTVSGSGFADFSFKERTVPAPGWLTNIERKHNVFVKMQADITVINPNVVLASQLGLTNPLMIAYEVTPWSFVANWVFNIEQYLSAGSAFYGLSVANAFTTVFRKGVTLRELANPWDNPSYKKGVWDTATMERTMGLTTPSLQFHRYKPPSWERAATAVSLLLQGNAVQSRHR